jgi:hypothetical protein
MIPLKCIEYKDEITTDYQNGLSVKAIAQKYNVYQQPIINVLKYLNIYNPKPRINQGNINYFSNINSKAKAYFLGFIAADGCIQKQSTSNTYGLTISIHKKDRYILEKFKKELKSDSRIYELKRDQLRYSIYNKQITSDLINLGIIPRKSLILKNIIVNIPKRYRHSFILGYFDGDGSVTLPEPNNPNITTLSISIRGTQELLQGLADELELTNYKIAKYDATYRLDFSKKSEVLKFFNLYSKNKIYLRRKYNKFLKRIN